MSIHMVNQSNTIPVNIYSHPNRYNITNGSALKVYDAQEKAPTKVKVGVFLTTLTGVATAMALVLHKKGVLNTPLKGLCKITYDNKKHEMEKLVGTLAVGSVGGGLIGGALFDKKENMKAKYREAVIQTIGNISTPLACVALGMKGFGKIEPKIQKMFQFGEKTKGIPGVLASAVCLVSGILLGNKVGNTINKTFFHVNDERKLKLSDMSPHIDDMCLAISLVASKSKIGPIVGRFVPLALLISGFSTGVTQEKPESRHA